MANTVKSPVDTLLGEAVSGTNAERFADMLGIASVIDNRAKQARVSPEAIVSAPGQFSAYGKAFPKGTEAYRAMAEKAWKQVQTVGPVTRATYYSTPAAQKNLPGGLQAVDQTKGHIYHIDPQNRAFVTAHGVVTPAADAVAQIASNVARTTGAILSGAANVVGNVADAVTGRKSSFPSAPGLPGVDQVGGLHYGKQKQDTIRGITIHHTAFDATPQGIVNRLNDQNYGALAPLGTKVSHMKNDKRGLNLGNNNMVGIEVIAADDKHVTQAQIDGTLGLIDRLHKEFPGVTVKGHGWLANDSRHKQPSEGQSIVTAYMDRMAQNKDRGLLDAVHSPAQSLAPAYSKMGADLASWTIAHISMSEALSHQVIKARTEAAEFGKGAPNGPRAQKH